MNSSLHLILILLAVAVGVVVLCRILKLPAMLGYLLVGIMIGPHALGWIPDAPETRHLAEFGVVFLMFSIGLEFSLARLRAMQRLVFGLGTAQVVATMVLVMLSSLFFELDWRAGLALGGILAMSSTAIVSKMLVERAELNAPHGQKIMGVLLFQDLAVVPLIIVIPALAESGADMSGTIAVAMFKAAILLVALLTFGQRLLRPWFHLVAGQKSSELFMLNVLLFTLGMAWLTELADLSPTLTAIDNSAAMIAALWHGRQRAILGDWLEMPFAPASFDTVIGDGCLVLLAQPMQHQRFFERLAKIVAPGGRILLRVFLGPEQPETREEVCRDALAGKMRSVHA
ncbi:MAG: cation:proton antiporter, partial [Nitrosomonadales bacterium]|nr:cation:proton antiporter [Nitrosomonadales bacterium]